MAREQRYRATVAYDGTDFLGYQIQAKGRTVQGELERSLTQITQTNVRVDGAGRTDAGVHAIGQVIAFNVVWRHSLRELHRAFNATLPHDIVITDLQIAASDFHPRFSALSRTYHYHIINRSWPNVLQRRYAYHVDRKLEITAMSQASHFLLGVQDFASFGKPPRGHNTVRNVMQATWSATDENELIFVITANAFLYRMVRTIVGTLVQVGLGRLAVSDVKEILEAKDLSRSAPPIPAHGLHLMQVVYPESI